MKNLIRTAAVAILLLAGAGGSAHAAQVSFGIRIGPPPRARIVRVPPRPGLDYTWVDGYWYPVNGRYHWHRGYWTRSPYGGARWIAPRYEGGRFYDGYWDGDHGRFDHNHRWDRDRDRDRDRFDRR
jgi:hypothetical protein